MCVMLWANGAILLKKLVHSSNIEHLVILAEKKSLWTVSVRGPNFGVSNILFLGCLSCFIQPSACCEDSCTSTFKQLCVMVAYEKFVQYLIPCVLTVFYTTEVTMGFLPVGRTSGTVTVIFRVLLRLKHVAVVGY